MYLSLESVEFGIQEQPSNIWVIRCVVLNMLMGKQPWHLKPGKEERLEIKRQIVEEVLDISSGISKEAKDFLNKCFVRNPADIAMTKILLSHSFASLQFLIGGEHQFVQSEMVTLPEPRNYEFGDNFIPLCSSSSSDY